MPVTLKPLAALPTIADSKHRRLKTLPDTESICAQHAAQPKNPTPGIVINHAKGKVVYKGVLKGFFFFNGENKKKYDDDTRRTDDTFTMKEKKFVGLEMKNILERVVQNDIFKENVDNIVENNSDSSSLKSDLTLQKELQMQNPARNENLEHKYQKKEKDYEKTSRKEMTACESEGIRGKYLSSIHEYLLTVKPTNVEAERAF
ncbi:hypothetical protein AVEN_263875-1 [Araneus ventricosus]|uniref:Uncharacterized protein n=1 Tax=Araneus ventricosus TaxID=182803 RepID=A0A4Y2LBV4_ARAVE|nr:hypothetical protein AVEN_263875-1 [Araneus ventricosus]